MSGLGTWRSFFSLSAVAVVVSAVAVIVSAAVSAAWGGSSFSLEMGLGLGSVVEGREGRDIIWLMMGLGLGWVRVKGSSSVKSLRTE